MGMAVIGVKGIAVIGVKGIAVIGVKGIAVIGVKGIAVIGVKGIAVIGVKGIAVIGVKGIAVIIFGITVISVAGIAVSLMERGGVSVVSAIPKGEPLMFSGHLNLTPAAAAAEVSQNILTRTASTTAAISVTASAHS
jgi:hypothetical protein